MPAVSNRMTTVVNAAFLQEVKDSNMQLWSILDELRTMQVSWDDAREVSKLFVRKLAELRDCIGLEFSLEETYGFMQGPPSNAGFAMADAETARIQHRELYLQLQELCETAEEAQYRGTISRDLQSYLEEFRCFDLSFRAHEDLEGELIRCGLGFGRSGANTL